MKVKQKEIVKAFRSLRENSVTANKKFEISLRKVSTLLSRKTCRITNVTLSSKVVSNEPTFILINPKLDYTDDNLEIVSRAYAAFRHLIVTNKCQAKIANDLAIIKKSVRKKNA